MKGLCISGGSTKLPFLAGVVTSLYKKKYYKAIAGNSSGAICALMLGIGKTKTLIYYAVNLVYSMFMRHDPNSIKGKIFAVLRVITGKSSLFDQSNLKKTIQKSVSEKEFNNWRESGKTDIYVCVVNENTAAVRLINLRECYYEQAIDFVCASAAIPVATEAIKVGSYKYVDGGNRVHCPVKLLHEIHPDYEFDVVFSRPEKLREEHEFHSDKIVDRFLRSQEILNWEISKDDELYAKSIGASIYYAPNKLTNSTYEIKDKKGNQDMFNKGIKVANGVIS